MKNFIQMKNTNEMKEFVNRNSLVEAQPKSSRRTTLHSRLSTFNFSLLTALSLVLCLLVGGKGWAAAVTVDFETNNFSQFDGTISNTSWTTTTSSPHGGSYCMKSNNAGSASSTASFSVTVCFISDASISFWAKISSESGYDKGYFYIDGSAQSDCNGISGAGSYINYTYNVTAGSHTFKWEYAKDVSVNSNDDCFYVDDIVFNSVCSTYKAEWVSVDVGSTSSWCIGETRTVTLQIKNTGTATWYNSTANGGDGSQTQTDHDMVAVSYHWDEDYDKDGNISYDMHNNRNHFPSNVAPGETATISFDVVGPRMKGANHLKFSMIRQECCWFYNQNNCSSAPERVVDVTVPDFTLAASNTVICNGGESVLSTNCDLPANIYTAQPYIWDWNSGAYNSGGGISNVSVSGSIIRFQTTNGDPQIPMYDIGSFDPNIYKTFRMRYRINSGTAGGMQVYHTWAGRTSATGEDQAHYGTLISDGNWHILEMDMVATAHTASNWTNCGAVLGWRLDVCSNSGVKMEIDWIGLFPDPIATNVSTYTATPSQTTTYYACNYVENRPYIHLASANVAVAANPSIEIVASTGSTECLTSSSGLTLTANAGTGYNFEVASGSYSSISGTSSVSGDDSYSSAVTLGSDFKFYYWGKQYTSAVIGTNGFLKLGDGVNNHANDLASTSYYNYLAAFWDDLYATSTKYTTLGSAPNRVFVMQHDGYRLSDASNTFSFQIKLYETTNIIEFCYGSGFPNVSNTSTTASIGLNNRENNVTSFISVTPTGAGTATISTTEVNNSIGTTQCDYLTSGTIYRFTPTLFNYAWTVTGTSGTASGTGNNTYNVSPSALTNTYTVSVTNAGCSATASKTVTTKPTITATSSVGNTACEGSDVILSATSNATDFTWSNGLGTEPSVTALVKSATTYSVTASSATCTNSGSVSVNVKSSPTITASPDPSTVCFNGSTAVTLTASGGTPVAAPFEYSEGFEGGSMPSGWTQSGDGTWNVNAGYGYNSIGTHSGTYNAVINHNTREYETFLITSKLDLSGVENAKLNFYYISYNWGSSDIDQLYVYYRVNEGSWTQLWYNTSDRQSWTSSGDINLPNPSANYQIGFKMIDKYGHGVGLDDISITGTKYVDPTYTWSSTGTSGSASGTTYTVTPSEGTNTYTVSAEGCSRSITIDVLTANNITASGLTTDCGVPVTLSASGIEGATYDWYDGNTLVQANSPSFTPTDIIYGKTYNVKVSKEIYGDVNEDVRTFTYTGTVQSVTIPEGTIAAKLEVWGAQSIYSSASPTTAYASGNGGYATGTMNDLTGVSTLYVYVGGQPGSAVNGSSSYYNGGWNGGGGKPSASSYNDNGPGGGATDICLVQSDVTLSDYRYTRTSESYLSRLIVAGGGGGGRSTSTDAAGGYVPGATLATGSSYYYATMNSAGTNSSNYIVGGFGYGSSTNNTSDDRGCGGGGWYGGGSYGDNNGGGGSSFVWCDAYASYVPSGYTPTASMKMTDVEVKAGSQSMPAPGGDSETGHSGNGYARTTFYVQNHITCTSQAKQVALTVTPLTTPSAQDKTICPGNTASLSVQSPVSGYTYHWESGSDSGTGNSFTTASLENTTTYHITATKAFDRIVAAYDFDYSGEMQDVVAPSGADYAILEVWGAEGGGSKANENPYPIGGKGGYAKGKMEVSSGQHFYVVVGGKGQDAVLGPGAAVVTALGGYNGGGGGTSDNEGTSVAGRKAAGGGGGATHIAKAAPSSGTDYQLYYYSSNQDDVLLVAGGGGGASFTQTGGYGGGTVGGRISNGGLGGAQTGRTSSGTQVAGVFGRGANASGNGNGNGNGVGGGGGGWYGGNINTVTNKNYNSGGGGSGHINTTQFLDYTILAGNQATIPNISGTGTETGHSGNGHARIVFYKNGGGECVSSVANVDAIVNTPSVGTLTFTTDQNICPGTAVTLQVTSVNPTASEGLSYVWKKGSTTISGATTNTLADITAEATYNVNVTATNILNGKTCTADQSQNIAVTYKKPSAEELTDMGAANGYYIWTGNSDDWSANNNWMKYSTSNGGTYTLTATPTNSATVAVGKYNTCVSGSSPTLNINEPALAKIFKVGTGVTVSGSSTLTVGGAVTNKGTINGSLAMTISGALTNSGTINGSTTMSVTGDVTNSGTIGSSSTMSVSGALTNSGTINSSLTLNGSNKTLTNNGTLNAPAVFNGVTTLAGSGSTTFSSVTINSGKTLKTSSHNITISGDWTNNGTLTAGTGSITMTGNLANNGIFNGAGGTISITGDLTNASTSTFKTAAGALSLNGNLTNSGTFTIGGAGAVTLTGNWTNNGTFTPTGAGAVIFAGTSSQVIGGSNATTFKNVQFNNSANSLSISNEPTITGTATFSSGVVTGNVTLGSAATVSGAGTSSYINGKVTKVMNANATFKFPIGTASLYAPFEAKSSAASNVSVQYASGSEDMPDWWNHSGNFSNVGLDHASDRENWQVSASATTNLSAIKLYWNTAAGNYHSFEEGADALESYLRIAAVKKNDFYWQNLGQSAIEGDFDGAGSITAVNPLAITVGAKAAGDNDYFVTFASTNKGNLLLPIELISFTATCDGRSSLIEWTTATEKNNDYFSLERSDDAINFTEITRVAGAGNSIEPIDYSYTDYGIHGGDNYYRLVQVDYDGTRTVSEIVVANCIESEVDEPEVQAYPNPFNGELTLVLDNFDNRPATIEVYDMLGKLIYIQKADAPQNSYETILNLSNLPPAAYTVRVSTNDFVINKNVVKN